MSTNNPSGKSSRARQLSALAAAAAASRAERLLIPAVPPAISASAGVGVSAGGAGVGVGTAGEGAALGGGGAAERSSAANAFAAPAAARAPSALSSAAAAVSRVPAGLRDTALPPDYGLVASLRAPLTRAIFGRSAGAGAGGGASSSAAAAVSSRASASFHYSPQLAGLPAAPRAAAVGAEDAGMEGVRAVAAAAQPPASLGPPAPAASPHSSRMCGRNSQAPRAARSRSRSPSSAVASITGSAHALLPGLASAAAVAAFGAVRDLRDENVAVRDGKIARRSAALAASQRLRALSQWPHLAPPSAELVQMLRHRLAREKSEISSLAAADAVCAGLPVAAGGVKQAAIASLSPRPPPAWRAPLSPLPMPSNAFLGSLSAPGVYTWGGTSTVMND